MWNVKGTYLRKRRSKIGTVKWQQTHNYQWLNLKKQKPKQTKQTSTPGTESQKWRSHGGYLGEGEGENGGKGTGNKKHKW